MNPLCDAVMEIQPGEHSKGKEGKEKKRTKKQEMGKNLTKKNCFSSSPLMLSVNCSCSSSLVLRSVVAGWHKMPLGFR